MNKCRRCKQTPHLVKKINRQYPHGSWKVICDCGNMDPDWWAAEQYAIKSWNTWPPDYSAMRILINKPSSWKDWPFKLLLKLYGLEDYVLDDNYTHVYLINKRSLADD